MTLPSSPALSALLLALPLVLLAGRGLAARVTTSTALRRLLTPAFGLALWLVVVHLTATFTASFVIGLVGGTTLCGLVGALAWSRRADEPRAQDDDEPVRWRWMGIGAAVSTLLVAPAALGWAFHDELFFTGHMSMAAQMQNDIYPPRHLTFPELELAYHYGFALICAGISTVTRLGLGLTIDLVTLGCFAYTSALLWLLGQRVAGPVGAPAMAGLGLFGAGLPFWAGPAGRPLSHQLLGVARVGGDALNAPTVSFFFQHPFTIGFPIGVAALLLLSERETVGRLRYVAFGVLLLALYLGQVVIFLTFGGALLVSEPLVGGELERERAWRVALVVAVVALASAAVGGFFAGQPDREAGGLTLRTGVGLWWHLQNFGLLLPLGIYGIARGGLLRIPLAVLVTGSFIVFNTVVYAHSHDIAKFAAVTAFALSIGAAVAVADLFGRLASRSGRALVVALGAATASGGLAFALVFILDLPGVPETLFHRAAEELSPDDERAVAFLRQRIHPGELVYRRPPASYGYAQLGGLPQPWLDAMVGRLGFSAARISRRGGLLQYLPTDIAPYREEGFRWLVLDPADEAWARLAQLWTDRGVAREAATFGDLRVIELLDE